MTVFINITEAPAFIAALVREGVTFDGVQTEDRVKITFTGGY